MPATVVMMPLALTLRMRLLLLSEIYRFPEASKATAVGLARLVFTAAPPSPEYPALLVPATVVMMPLVATLRMREL